MKLTPGRSTAAPLLLVALATRMFWSMELNYPQVQNAAWICPLLGVVFYMPFAFASVQACKIGRDSAWENLTNVVPRTMIHFIETIFILLLLADCAASLRLLANTASVMALGDAAIATLELPLALSVAAVILLGADAQGNSARFWLRILPLLLIIMVIVQFEAYNPAWLAPVLGSGMVNIISGSLYCASCMALLTLLWLVAVPDRGKSGLLMHVVVASVAASALLLLHQMLSPVLVDATLTRASRMEQLLGNGRVAISLQLLLIVIWYGNMLHLIAAEAIAAACYMQRLLPKMRVWGIAVLIAIVTALLGSTQFIHVAMRYEYFRWEYALVGLGLLLPMMYAGFRKGGLGLCENSNVSHSS